MFLARSIKAVAITFNHDKHKQLYYKYKYTTFTNNRITSSRLMSKLTFKMEDIGGEYRYVIGFEKDPKVYLLFKEGLAWGSFIVDSADGSHTVFKKIKNKDYFEHYEEMPDPEKIIELFTVSDYWILDYIKSFFSVEDVDERFEAFAYFATKFKPSV